MHKQTILYITELFPYPPDSGAKIKSINTIQTLSKKFNIVLIAFSDQKITLEQRLKISKITIFHKVFLLPNLNQEPKNNLEKLLKNYLKLKPYFLYQFHSKSAERFVSKLTSKFNFCAVHIDHLNMAQYLPKTKNCPWIYEEHNIESDLAKSKFINFTKFSKTKLFLLLEYVFTQIYEKRIIRSFDHIFAISSQDQTKIRDLYSGAKTSVQNVVFLPSRISKTKHKNPNLLFIGDTSWHPNTEALKWFIKKIWPSVLKTKPTAVLNVVGKIEDQNQISNLLAKNVFFHGFQENLTPYLSSADLFILPFLSGSGVRIKALTAIAHQIPIVSTSTGIFGLNLKSNLDYLEANSEIEFAKKTIMLLSNKKIAQSISQSALIYLEKNHSQKEDKAFILQYQNINLRSPKSVCLPQSSENGTKFLH